MAEKRPLEDEDEYHFPTHEFTGGEEAEPHVEETETVGEYKPVSKRSYQQSAQDIIENLKQKLIKYKRFVAIFGIIVVILIAFELMRPHHTTKIISEVPRQQESQVTQQASTLATPALSTESLASLREQAGAGEVGRLQETTKDQGAQLSHLEDQVSTLGADLRQLKDAQTKLNDNVVTLSHQIRELNAEMLATAQVPSKKTAMVLRPILPVYHVRAVIPGRAWLEDDQGQTRTVAVGDRLIGYGVVQKIDAQRGIVSTDSGKNIGYGQR